MEWFILYCWFCLAVFIICVFTEWFDGETISLGVIFLWAILSIIPLVNVFIIFSAMLHLLGKAIPFWDKVVDYPILKGRKRG